jgi:glycosyltransferase involved in cell wall biosynthesis
MAMGLPVVAFSRSVSREILGDAGILAEMKNALDLGEKIVWALRNRDTVRRLGEKARERAVQNLSWEAVGRRIDLRYSQLAQVL